MNGPFAVWITGIPASGKSTISRELIRILGENHGIRIAHLESDRLRKVLTPKPAYDPEERKWFYKVLVLLGQILIESGMNVLFDATANRRAYRDFARSLFPRFLEVHVRCPLEVCISRDPKGIYKRGKEEVTATVPGLQEPYEEPRSPEVIVDSDQMSPQQSAQLIVEKLKKIGWI